MRNKCDYTLSTLKKQFPISLQTACPVAHLRKYMARSFRHMDVLRAIGRDGDFRTFPSLDKEYKRHRDSLVVGADLDGRRRQRDVWGSVSHARRTAEYGAPASGDARDADAPT